MHYLRVNLAKEDQELLFFFFVFEHISFIYNHLKQYVQI